MPQHHHHPHDLGTQGMLLFGDRTIYLSHLPMFDEPTTTSKVLLDVELASGAGDPADQYRRDRESSR